jgi:hypothetical protein
MGKLIAGMKVSADGKVDLRSWLNGISSDSFSQITVRVIAPCSLRKSVWPIDGGGSAPGGRSVGTPRGHITAWRSRRFEFVRHSREVVVHHPVAAGEQAMEIARSAK